MHQRVKKEIGRQDSGGFDRLSQSVRSLPVKPALVTFTAAAAITALVMVGDQYLNGRNENSMLITPRIATPSRPGTNQPSPNLNPLMQNQRQIGAIQDSSFTSPYLTKPASSTEDILQQLRSQTHTVRDVKDSNHNRQ
ncbi:hypothetical protein ACFL6I_07745 [candidate division KSB1 bacterium]